MFNKLILPKLLRHLGNVPGLIYNFVGSAKMILLRSTQKLMLIIEVCELSAGAVLKQSDVSGKPIH